MKNPHMWFVYMLLCDKKTFYIGFTPDIIKRFHQHSSKESFFTKKFSDLTLVYCERYASEKDSVKREKQLKGWSRAKKQLLIEGKLGINTCTEFVELCCLDEKFALSNAEGNPSRGARHEISIREVVLL